MATMKTTNNKMQAELRLGWGMKGVRAALRDRDAIVIIDQLRFSSTVVTAIARGFVIEPATDKRLRTPGYGNSPYMFAHRKPARIVMSSANGAFLAMNAKNAKYVLFGSILNAKAVADYIDALGCSATLIAAGEKTADIDSLRSRHEKEQCEHNSIYAKEDLLAAGAISHFSAMQKSKACASAEEKFRRHAKRLHSALMATASHRWLAATKRGYDTKFSSKLNRYDAVPRLYLVRGVAEIRKEKEEGSH